MKGGEGGGWGERQRGQEHKVNLATRAHSRKLLLGGPSVPTQTILFPHRENQRVLFVQKRRYRPRGSLQRLGGPEADAIK